MFSLFFQIRENRQQAGPWLSRKRDLLVAMTTPLQARSLVLRVPQLPCLIPGRGENARAVGNEKWSVDLICVALQGPHALAGLGAGHMVPGGGDRQRPVVRASAEVIRSMHGICPGNDTCCAWEGARRS